MENQRYNLQKETLSEKMLQTAKKLVGIPSINSTEGEYNIGIYLENYIREMPYFKNHPEQVIIQELKEDPLHRRSVFALLLGEKEPDGKTGKTLLFHGHTDTVGIEEYGALKEFAYKPDELKEELRKIKLPEEVEKDLLSGDYMFGRGACDMKSGDAVFLGILEKMCEHPKDLNGNILVSFNPVEENLHTGITEGLDILEELKERYGLEYILAINNDFICPLFEGDKKYTIYTGTVGKLLPCFYVQGKETHVGQCFEGFDASMVTAALVKKLNLNLKYSDTYAGETAYPPSVLKMKDLKLWYNVQTASSAFVYFNYFVHNASMEQITELLKAAAKEALEETLDRINEMAHSFSLGSKQEYHPYSYPLRVFAYEELLAAAEEKKAFSKEKLQEVMEKEMEKGTDKREVPIEMIRFLLHTADITTPCIVLYYAAPYCPHNTLLGKDEEKIREIKNIIEAVTKETKAEYRFMKFFPSLSDSSYLKLDDSEASIKKLTNNFPGFEVLYPVPLEKIRNLDIPAINYGCYGKDAHKWTERVNIPYTFEVLPKLIERTIEYYLKQ